MSTSQTIETTLQGPTSTASEAVQPNDMALIYHTEQDCENLESVVSHASDTPETTNIPVITGFRFLELPAELRNHAYKEYLKRDSQIGIYYDRKGNVSTCHIWDPRPFETALLRTNRQIYNESHGILYDHQLIFSTPGDFHTFFGTIGREAANVWAVDLTYLGSSLVDWETACASLRLATTLEQLNLWGGWTYTPRDFAHRIAGVAGNWLRDVATRKGSISRALRIIDIDGFDVEGNKEFREELECLLENRGTGSALSLGMMWIPRSFCHYRVEP